MVGEDRIRTYQCFIAPDFTSVAVSKSLSRLNYGSGSLTTWIFTLVPGNGFEPLTLGSSGQRSTN